MMIQPGEFLADPSLVTFSVLSYIKLHGKHEWDFFYFQNQRCQKKLLTV